MPSTPVYLLPYPATTDPANVPLDMQELADRLEVVLPTVGGSPPDATASVKGIVQLAGDLSGSAASPQIAAGAIVDADINAAAAVAASKLAGYPADATKVLLGNGTWAAPPASTPADATTTSKGVVQLAGDLAGTAASPQIAAGAVTDAEVAAANKDGTAATPSLRTLGTGAAQAAAGNDSRLTNARTPTAHATTHQPGGSDPMAVDAVAATGSLRTLGTGATQAAAGNDSRLSDARTPTGTASGDLSGTYPSPQIAAGVIVNADIAAAAAIAASKLAGYPSDATKALMGDGSWAVPAGSSVWTKITEPAPLASAAANIDLTSIPGTYTHLVLFAYLKSAAASGWLTLKVNNDGTSGNYNGNAGAAGAAGMGLTGNAENADSTSPSAAFTMLEIWIPYYASTTQNKTVRSISSGYAAGSGMWTRATQPMSGVWISTAAITRLTLAATSGNLATGCRVALFGIT